MEDDLRRYLAYERRISERLSTRVEPFRHGMAFLDDGYPLRYDSNYLELFEPAPDATFDGLLAEADRILASFGHREVLVNHEGDGVRLEQAFAAAGWEVERDWLMVLRRQPDRPAALAVEELPFEQVRELIREVNLREHGDPDAVEMLTDYEAKLERVVGARFFAARVDGTLAGSCELYVEGRDAQVEMVNTLEEHRGRGVARSVVLAAIDAARRGGAERVWIVADELDWPKDLYTKLGFDRVATVWQFRRPTPRATPPGA
jgi:GNAT superfamily N-acetyltransferase